MNVGRRVSLAAASTTCHVTRLLQRRVSPRTTTPYGAATIVVNTSFARNVSKKIENQWKDGSVVYSTSKAARHSVNETIGLNEKEPFSWKPFLFGSLSFAAIIYIMFFYDGQKNDVFQTITPESVQEDYEKSVNRTTETVVTTT